MEETIKGIEVIAYKGMNSDMTCRGFQYEIGKSYKTDKVKLCNCGFHACLNPRDVLEYYPKYASSRYFKVKLSSEITKCEEHDTKVAAIEITILEEISIKGLLNIAEWWKHENVLNLLYFSDGFVRIRNWEKKYNFINKDGKLLSKQWFEWVGFSQEGFARVQRTNGDWNFIDKEGNYLSEKWFEWVGDFRGGFARVQRGDKLWNFIDKKGNILSKEWFEWIGDFRGGFARVQRTNDEWAKIDKTGKLIKD